MRESKVYVIQEEGCYYMQVIIISFGNRISLGNMKQSALGKEVNLLHTKDFSILITRFIYRTLVNSPRKIKPFGSKIA